MRSLGKPGPGDALDVKGFVGDETVGIHQPSRLFVVEVSALVRRLFVKAGTCSRALRRRPEPFFFRDTERCALRSFF